MKHWLSRNWWLLLSLGVLGGFIYGYTRIHLEEVGDKYTIIVDLILIILAVIAVAGYGLYRWICRGIDERVEHRLRENENALSARLHASTGFVFWEHYREKPLKVAIARTWYALEFAERLDEKQYENVICTCKQNLAYYLAEKKESKDDAHKLAKYAYERARDEKGRYKYGKSYNWEETYAWVLWQFAGEDKVWQDKARNIVDKLQSNPDIPPDWRKEVKDKWDKVFSQSGQTG